MTALWQSIDRALRQEIATGAYGPGEKLPTEARLAERFGVNRHTVRRALAQMAEDGLVHARRGAGVFVLARPLDYPLSNRTRFHENLQAAGRLPDRKLLSVETRAATAADARRLALAEGDVLTVVHSLSFADGTPVALAEARFPEARLPGLAEALRAETGVTKALSRLGITDYIRASTRLTAVNADATQALHLQLREGAPLLFSEALNRTPDGLPVEHGQTWFASERITLTLDHEAGA
ncbi:MAG: phosphonate metabolism transcriptional regulator PhnF [Silicimonas sp.]|nr:phosphonate metabolism transcriptional regulator PhnF [Silicimonas sp.]